MENLNNVQKHIVINQKVLVVYVKIKELDLLHPLIFFLYLLLYIAALTSVSIFFSSVFGRSSSSLFAIILFYSIVQYFNAGSTALISIFHYMNNIITLENISASILTFLIYLIIFLVSSILIFEVRDL